jgi:hypothetical protein
MLAFDRMTSIASIAVTSIGMFVGPLIAVRMSVKQFRSTRWWEKQEEAYREIMGALATLQHALARWFDDSVQMRNLSQPEKDSLNRKSEEAREMIDKAAATGAYLISEDASQALATLKRELDKNDGPGNWVAEIERHHAAVEACITKMRSCARRDLRTHR